MHATLHYDVGSYWRCQTSSVEHSIEHKAGLACLSITGAAKHLRSGSIFEASDRVVNYIAMGSQGSKAPVSILLVAHFLQLLAFLLMFMPGAAGPARAHSGSYIACRHLGHRRATSTRWQRLQQAVFGVLNLLSRGNLES